MATVKRHLVISDEAAHTIAAWTAGTYSYDQFSIWPKLIVRSPVKRCGKTVLLEIIDGLAHRSLLASSISPSAIFRVIDAWQPTMIIDEADTMAKDNEELRGILNAGHRKNSAHVIRNVPINKGFEPKKFSVWAPQVLAAIGDLWDTVTDRSIVVQLDRKKPGDQIVKLPLGFRQECLHLRRKSLRWAMDSQAERKRVQPSLPKHTNDRALDNWFPLFAISEVLGSHWPERIGQAFQRLEPVDETAADLKVMLLADLRDLLDGQHKTHSEEVCEHLNSLEDRPWASFRHGRGINGNALATMLKDFRKPNGSPIKAGNV